MIIMQLPWQRPLEVFASEAQFLIFETLNIIVFDNYISDQF